MSGVRSVSIEPFLSIDSLIHWVSLSYICSTLYIKKKFWLIRCVINGFGEVGIRFQNHHFNLFKKTLSAKETLNNDKYLLSKIQ